ncbi:polysaccharide biosynthesis/export family protein [Sphingomonas sp.]|uniref:polysaccharide biosynthesis/export family protein n=1 Tax=Sphingomonas sp. TaxID=28214 RepID=UPI001B21FBF1|nr:polysaccharide biosynthesis/export family protein [Sphingomonas sp.]MBO9712657.1 polysaccharide export protein [Sphingomonas sp.]
MWAAIIAAAVTLTGCASRGGPVPYGVRNFGAPSVPTAADLNQDYHVGARDVLTISVFRVPTLSGDMQVEANGSIIMPLLGPVPVMGKTTLEVAADLRQRLGEKYLQSPEVQVSVKASPRLRITVDGAVTSGGVFSIDGPTTLMQAVAMAKGTSDTANPRRVVVFRTIDGQRMAAAFDLTDIRRGLNPDPVIYGDDIIIVDGDRWRSRFKDVVSSIPLAALFSPF